MHGTTRHAALLAAVLAVHLSLSSAASHGSKVTLKLTDNMKLPSAYAGDKVSGEKTYKYDGNVGEKNAIMDTFVFVVGETKLLQVIDTANHSTAASKIIDMYNVGAPGTDVAACKTADERLLAVSTQGKAGKQAVGRVLLFTVADDGKLTFKKEFGTVGSLPDQIKWTKDCMHIIAAIEGEAALTGTTTGSVTLDNPLGGVAVLKFTGKVADDTEAAFKFYDFKEYVAANSAAMIKDGVRWCVRPDTRTIFDKNEASATIAADMATLDRDLEPEYLALSSDGKKVYVALQEASAIATFDLGTNKFTNVKALAAKNWAETEDGLDASNKDSADGDATINMQKWPIFGMLMPDTIDIYTAADGKEYIVMANEGDDKEYELELKNQGTHSNETHTTVWTEMIRGKDMADAGMAMSTGNANKDADVSDQKKLGRIKTGWFDGRTSTFGDKKFEKLMVMGGRSFSIISTETFETVYDSGSIMEKVIKDNYANIFNSEAEDGGEKAQTANMDGRSDDKGLEVESLTIASVCDKTYLFVGGERTSTIFVFDITSPTNVTLESHISAAGDVTKKPKEIFAVDPEPRPNKDLGQIDPEMMSFDAERKLLIVSGAVSGTLGIYEVQNLPSCASNETALDASSHRATPAHSMSVMLALVAVLLGLANTWVE